MEEVREMSKLKYTDKKILKTLNKICERVDYGIDITKLEGYHTREFLEDFQLKKVEMDSIDKLAHHEIYADQEKANLIELKRIKKAKRNKKIKSVMFWALIKSMIILAPVLFAVLGIKLTPTIMSLINDIHSVISILI